MIPECSAECEFLNGGLCTCSAKGDPCPICDGTGGSVSGYYEPEWSDCDCCEGAGRATANRVSSYHANVAAMDAWIDEQVKKIEGAK